MKMPAFQFYPADWRKDPGVQALNRHDRSVWFDMLCIMHESDERGVLLLAGRPVPEDALARMLNLDNQTFNQTLTNILTYGVASRRQSDGAIYSRRMVKDESLCQVRREAGKKGGNPGLVNQKHKQNPTTGVNQSPTPSSSSSISSSSSEKETTSSFQSEVDAPQKKIGADEVSEPQPAAATPGGATDVGTAKPKKPPRPLLTGDLAELLNPGRLAERVQTMKSPFTQFEADALCAKYGTEAARQIVKEMANYAKLTNNLSANLTAQKWLDKREKPTPAPVFRPQAPATSQVEHRQTVIEQARAMLHNQPTG